MGAKNKVIAGDYEGKGVGAGFGQCYIVVGFGKNLYLNKDIIEAYEVISDDHRKSAASGVARGLVGGALLGPVGLLAGGLSAKNKGTYNIVLQFKDGKKSLIEVDDKIYKAIMKIMF